MRAYFRLCGELGGELVSQVDLHDERTRPLERPLRIGLLLDSLTVDAWVTDVIDFILSHDRLELGLVVLDGRERPAREPQSLWERLRSNHALYYRLMAIDERRAAANGWLHEELDLSECLYDVSQRTVVPHQQGGRLRLDERDVDGIRDEALDILLSFGFDGLIGEILQAATYGVWKYRHSDTDDYRGECPGFWEVYENNPVSGITLEVVDNSPGGGRVLSKTYVRTHPTSPMINLARQQETGTILFRRAVEELLRKVPSPQEFLETFPLTSKPYEKAPCRKPTTPQMLKFGGRAMLRSLVGKLTGKSRPAQWSIGIWPHDTSSLNGKPIEDIDWYEPRSDHFIADPCAIESDGRLHLFVEEYVYEKERAHISVMEYDRETGFTDPQKILGLDCHLSFPYVFEDEGTYYMIPEQLESGQVVLYRCEEFPDRWTQHCVLLDDFYGADTVIFRQDGLYWMFTTNGRAGNWDSNLHLMYSTKLCGPYTPHPQTPVSITLYGSRMAGRIHQLNGRLIRPGQNCVEKYGGSLVLHEILCLTPDRYEERVIGEVRPNPTDPFGDALHTIAMLPTQTVVDGLRYL